MLFRSGRSLRLARRILANAADAADVVQESYIRAYIAWRNDELRGGDDAHAAWLKRVVTRRSLDLLRARRRLREESDEGIEQLVGDGPHDGHGDLEAALLALPVAQRTAFVLRELEGFSLRETAEQLGCTVGAVEQRVIRAWANLRRRLHDEER